MQCALCLHMDMFQIFVGNLHRSIQKMCTALACNVGQWALHGTMTASKMLKESFTYSLGPRAESLSICVRVCVCVNMWGVLQVMKAVNLESFCWRAVSCGTSSTMNSEARIVLMISKLSTICWVMPWYYEEVGIGVWVWKPCPFFAYLLCSSLVCVSPRETAPLCLQE